MKIIGYFIGVSFIRGISDVNFVEDIFRDFTSNCLEFIQGFILIYA